MIEVRLPDLPSCLSPTAGRKSVRKIGACHMLSFLSKPRQGRMCDGVSRRDFLRHRSPGPRRPDPGRPAPPQGRRRSPPEPAQSRSSWSICRAAPATSTCTTSSPTPRPSIAASSSRSGPTCRHRHLRADAPAGQDRRQVCHPARPQDPGQPRSDRTADGHSRPRPPGRSAPFAGPAFGCVVSKLRGSDGPIPPYVSVSDHRLLPALRRPRGTRLPGRRASALQPSRGRS